MAQIAVGGGGHGKKAVDVEVPLVPFIDLLLCCLMFLLVSAVWNQLARIEAQTAGAGGAAETQPMREEPTLLLRLERDTYVLSSPAGVTESVASDAELAEALGRYRKVLPNLDEVRVAADDGVRFERVVAAMDLARGVGYSKLALSDGT